MREVGCMLGGRLRPASNNPVNIRCSELNVGF